MNLNQYTEKAQEAVLQSQRIAQEYGQQTIEPEHLLFALLTQNGGITPAILRAANVNPARIQELVERELKSKPKVRGSTGDVTLSREVSAIADKAEPVTIEEMEKRHVAAMLNHTDWNKTRAAELLGYGVEELLGQPAGAKHPVEVEAHLGDRRAVAHGRDPRDCGRRAARLERRGL